MAKSKTVKVDFVADSKNLLGAVKRMDSAVADLVKKSKKFNLGENFTGDIKGMSKQIDYLDGRIESTISKMSELSKKYANFDKSAAPQASKDIGMANLNSLRQSIPLLQSKKRIVSEIKNIINTTKSPTNIQSTPGIGVIDIFGKNALGSLNSMAGRAGGKGFQRITEYALGRSGGGGGKGGGVGKIAKLFAGSKNPALIGLDLLAKFAKHAIKKGMSSVKYRRAQSGIRMALIGGGYKDEDITQDIVGGPNGDSGAQITSSEMYGYGTTQALKQMRGIQLSTGLSGKPNTRALGLVQRYARGMSVDPNTLIGLSGSIRGGTQNETDFIEKFSQVLSTAMASKIDKGKMVEYVKTIANMSQKQISRGIMAPMAPTRMLGMLTENDEFFRKNQSVAGGVMSGVGADIKNYRQGTDRYGIFAQSIQNFVQSRGRKISGIELERVQKNFPEGFTSDEDIMKLKSISEDTKKNLLGIGFTFKNILKEEVKYGIKRFGGKSNPRTTDMVMGMMSDMLPSLSKKPELLARLIQSLMSETKDGAMSKDGENALAEIEKEYKKSNDFKNILVGARSEFFSTKYGEDLMGTAVAIDDIMISIDNMTLRPIGFSIKAIENMLRSFFGTSATPKEKLEGLKFSDPESFMNIRKIMNKFKGEDQIRIPMGAGMGDYVLPTDPSKWTKDDLNVLQGVPAQNFGKGLPSSNTNIGSGNMTFKGGANWVNGFNSTRKLNTSPIGMSIKDMPVEAQEEMELAQGWIKEMNKKHKIMSGPWRPRPGKKGAKRLHAGLDYTMKPGTPIKAPFSGTSEGVSYDKEGWGNYVIIKSDKDPNLKWAIGHLAKASKFKKGMKVTPEDIVGYSGSDHLDTKFSYGPMIGDYAKRFNLIEGMGEPTLNETLIKFDESTRRNLEDIAKNTSPIPERSNKVDQDPFSKSGIF